jgi:hypothetical protein
MSWNIIYAAYFNMEAVELAFVFLNSREYSAFQLLLKLRTQVRESLQVLNLNTWSYFEELLASQQKQTMIVVQFLQNREWPFDCLKLMKLFSQETDNIFDVLNGFLIIESVQLSMYCEKVRAILEFYLLALFYSFVSYHTRVVAKSLIKIHKHQCKNRIDESLLTTLLEETCVLQTEVHHSQAAMMRATDLLLCIEVTCTETELCFG